MYAILDIESTGGKYNEEGIMEIAIYRFDGHKVVDTFAALINPKRDIQPFVARLTGINASLLSTAPTFGEVAQRIIAITEGATLVAHNAQFDYRILRTEFKRWGVAYERQTLCTVTLSKKLLPEAESYKLGKLARALGFPVRDRHRAQGDALATLALFRLLLSKDVDSSLAKRFTRAAAHGTLSQRQLDIVAGLPAEIGVYFLHNKEGEVVFIASAKDIKRRVTQHFTHGGVLARRLQKKTQSVTYEKTGSELIALLRAYEARKKRRPKYNALGKKPLFSHVITFGVDGVQRTILKVVKHTFQQRRSMGFKGVAPAQHFLQKLRDEFDLCSCSLGQDRPCRLPAAEGTPCTEKVLQAFARYSLYGKTMVLADCGREAGEQSFVLVKNGTVQGFGYAEVRTQITQVVEAEAMLRPLEGDKNTTFIVESYWRKHPRLKQLALTSVL